MPAGQAKCTGRASSSKSLPYQRAWETNLFCPFPKILRTCLFSMIGRSFSCILCKQWQETLLLFSKRENNIPKKNLCCVSQIFNLQNISLYPERDTVLFLIFLAEQEVLPLRSQDGLPPWHGPWEKVRMSHVGHFPGLFVCKAPFFPSLSLAEQGARQSFSKACMPQK